MRWLNRLAKAVLSVAIAAYVGIHAVALAHPAPGWNIGIFVAGGVAIILLLVSESALRDRRPTLRTGRREGRAGVWIEPAAKPIVFERKHKASLRKETLALVADIHAYVRSQPAPFVETIQSHRTASRAMDAAASDEERNRLWNEYTAQLTGAHAREVVPLAVELGDGDPL